MLVVAQSTDRLLERLKHELPQGILLSGPAGVGLHTIAREIARSHTKEVITVEPDAKGTIGIETVRTLYTLGRSKGKLTVFIIDDAEAMGTEAQNALLKLLEEPIPSVHFILTSHAPQQLLETVRSRVEEHAVVPISTAQSGALLDQAHVSDPTKRAQLQFLAGGLPAALIRYVNDRKLFEARSATVRDARAYLQGSREDRLLLSARYNDRPQALDLLGDMLRLVRRGAEASPETSNPEVLESILAAEAALMENASVRLTLTSLALNL